MGVANLNTPLMLEARQREADGMGGHRVNWRKLGTVHAMLRSSSGGLRGAEVGAESFSRWKITLRAFPAGDPRRPLPGQRLRMGERIFRIDAVSEQDPAGRFLTVSAQEE